MLFGSVATRDERLEPLFHVTPRQQEAPLARGAAQANVGSQSHDGPLVTTAWMLFSEPDHVSDAEFSRRSTRAN